MLCDLVKLTDGHPDACSYRLRFGLLIPATTNTMESELWSILVPNRDNGFTAPVLHTGRLLWEF
jgi:maleate cis-trans isomerase